jgi:hypothetical protein
MWTGEDMALSPECPVSMLVAFEKARALGRRIKLDDDAARKQRKCAASIRIVMALRSSRL